MSAVAFLLDENIPTAVVEAVRAAEPALTLLHVGHDVGTPPKGTRDPDVLSYAEANELALVTFDKRSMTTHVADHLTGGHHTWGVFIFPTGNNLGPGRIAEELVLVWATSQKDEWVDPIEFLPY